MKERVTQEQRERFRSDGYLVLPRAIPEVAVEHARRRINASLGAGIDPDRITEFRSRSFCPELRHDPDIQQLARLAGVWEFAEALVGSELERYGDSGTQLAIRFPSASDHEILSSPHVDGMYSPDNGLVEGDIYSFTALIGVALSDVEIAHGGNFTVWPGSHTLLARRFGEVGPQSLMEGMPDIDYGTPVPLQVSPGDVVLAHYLLAHTVGPHCGPDIRYMTFDRLTTVGHDQRKWPCLVDPWFEWPAMGR